MTRFLLVDNGSIHTEKLRRLLPNHSDVVSFGDLQPNNVIGYDCIILSGSSRLPVVGNEKMFEAEIDIIKESIVPIIGVCLGAELIGRAFGGTLHDLGEKRKGLLEITSTDERGILLERGRTFKVYAAHRWALSTAPKDFETIATSDHGPELIKHVDRAIWGIQFHPEHMTDSSLGDEILLRIITHSISGPRS